jgi:hypothetical protein
VKTAAFITIYRPTNIINININYIINQQIKTRRPSWRGGGGAACVCVQINQRRAAIVY